MSWGAGSFHWKGGVWIQSDTLLPLRILPQQNYTQPPFSLQVQTKELLQFCSDWKPRWSTSSRHPPFFGYPECPAYAVSWSLPHERCWSTASRYFCGSVFYRLHSQIQRDRQCFPPCIFLWYCPKATHLQHWIEEDWYYSWLRYDKR